MKHLCFSMFVFLTLELFSPLLANDTLYIYMCDSSVVGFPVEAISSVNSNTDTHSVIVGDKTYSCSISDIDSASFRAPVKPQFATFYFNDKYNQQLPSNVDLLFNETNNRWEGSVNSIGHYLVPSFQLKEGVNVFLDGEKVKSKISVLNFKDKVDFQLVDSSVLLLTNVGGKYEFLPQQKIVSVSVHFPSDTANVNQVYVWTQDGKAIESKTEYLNARMEIQDNGVFLGFDDSTQIKGRGNTTWGNTSKKPYRLKLFEKGKPLGQDKGKSWNLINNYRDSSMMSNAMAMKIGHMLRIPYTNHMLPVDLYINGEYRGNYTFTQKIGIANNSIDAKEEEGAYLLEFDTYFFDNPSYDKYNERYKDSSSIFHLPFAVSEPDLDEMPEAQAQHIFASAKLDLENLERTIQMKDSDDILNFTDVELLARTFFVYDITFNNEVNWPKSVYFYKTDTLGALLNMGPIWDFDLSFGQYDQMYDLRPATDWRLLGTPVLPNDVGYTYKGSGYMFFYYMRQNRAFQKAYYEVYKEFAQRLPEVFDFAEAYYAYTKNSFVRNSELWKCGENAEALLQRFKEWMEYRLETVYRHMREYDRSLPERP